jgi:hypothetical protein
MTPVLSDLTLLMHWWDVAVGEVEMMVISKMLKIPILVYTVEDERKAGCAPSAWTLKTK